MTSDDIAAVLKRERRLSAYGIGLYNAVSRAEGEEMFRRDGEDLMADVDGCTRAESWIRGMARRKTINRDRSSYGLKHVAEAEVGYITNGAFICAAIHLGFAYEARSGPNPGFNISEKSVKQAED